MRPTSARSLAALVALLAGCHQAGSSTSQAAPAQLNQLTAAEQAAGWQLLFDGRKLDHWRGFRETEAPAGWSVVDGAITRTGEGRDLITRRDYGSFELSLEWQVSPGGNSGIFYRGTEEYDQVYWSAPEMQVLDDAGHPDGQSRLTAAGACYGLYASPAGVERAAGQWNQVRLVVKGNHVEHWLNGQQVVTYELGSDDWKARVAASKFGKWPHYGQAPAGFIALQNHGDWVAFRNIKIRELQ